MTAALPLRRVLPALGAVLAACLAVVGLAQPTDAQFLAAKRAFDRGDVRQLVQLSPDLAGHVLEPYVTYWQLKLAIDATDPDLVRKQIAQWEGTPLGDRLRVDLLKALGKRGDWDRFGLEYSTLATDDIELACYAIQFRIQREGLAALGAAKPLWFTEKATPESCDPLFAALIARNDLSIAERSARFRLATEAGQFRLAQAIAGELPGEARITPREFRNVDADPRGALARGTEINLKQYGGRELALYALERAARRDAAGARTAWLKWRERFSAADRAYGDGRIALHAARQHHPAASDWFRSVPAPALNAEQHAWRVRAALRAQSWTDVQAAVEAMPPEQAHESSWQYWRARALAALGRVEEARDIQIALADEASFYGLLAAAALGRRPAQVHSSYTADPDLLAVFGARADVKRVVKLAELDLRPEMLREWSYIMRGRDDERLLLAADFARRNGLYDRAISAADRTVARHDFALRYLMPYSSEFAAAARDQGVDPALLYGIARQESRFIPDIVSSAGAVGVMQLMPATARWVGKQLGRPDARPALNGHVGENTQFGAYYFRYWLDRLDGMPALAAAAYNAGPGRAQAWRPAAPLEGAAWVESIPFNETRDYVKKVLANSHYYAHALGQPYVALTERLAVIAPRGSSGNGTPVQ